MQTPFYAMSLRVLFLIGLIVMVAACGGDDNADFPTGLPADAAPASDVLQAAPVEDASPVPTRTPLPDVRPTLPPTWTPTPTATALPPTETPTPIPIVQIIDPDPACDSFGPNVTESDEAFTLGESPRIAWREIAGAQVYRVRIVDEELTQIYSSLVRGGAFNVPPEIFLTRSRYGWSVEPINNNGEQMCQAIGGLLNARSRFD